MRTAWHPQVCIMYHNLIVADRSPNLYKTKTVKNYRQHFGDAELVSDYGGHMQEMLTQPLYDEL